MDKKIWFITGISSGLGKAIANEVIQRGDFVIGTFRQKEQVETFNLENKNKGFAYKLDITNLIEVEKTINLIEEKYKKINVLVNNAGIGFVGSVEETSLEETRNVFEANFFSSLFITQKILPIMRSQKSGNIIQISSHGGIKAFAGFGIYNASKFALEGFSEALAQEVSGLGIKITIVEPGPFRTEFASTKLNEAKKIITDYNETAGVFREKLKGVHGKQEGSPEKAATVIYDFVQKGNSTLRLPLGKIPLVTIQMKLDSVGNDLKVTRELAEKAVY